MYQTIIKPLLDWLVALLVLVLFLPVLIILVALLAYANKGTPFFVQSRPGKNECVFQLIKFKTMRDAYDGAGNPLPDRERITTIGHFIRKASLDELPQLLNVLKGDMSLIGPRPLLVKYLPLYNEMQKRRHEVKPGITGWAQVNGRNAIDWETKFAMDVWYVDHLSFALDVKIAVRTIYKIIKREGINATAVQTMKPFNGTSQES